jgi:hypothetical protein
MCTFIWKLSLSIPRRFPESAVWDQLSFHKCVLNVHMESALKSVQGFLQFRMPLSSVLLGHKCGGIVLGSLIIQEHVG